MQHVFLWQEELNSFYTNRNAGKIMWMDIMSLAAEQIAQNAEDLIGCNVSCLIICHSVNGHFTWELIWIWILE